MTGKGGGVEPNTIVLCSRRRTQDRGRCCRPSVGSRCQPEPGARLARRRGYLRGRHVRVVEFPKVRWNVAGTPDRHRTRVAVPRRLAASPRQQLHPPGTRAAPPRADGPGLHGPRSPRCLRIALPPPSEALAGERALPWEWLGHIPEPLAPGSTCQAALDFLTFEDDFAGRGRQRYARHWSDHVDAWSRRSTPSDGVTSYQVLRGEPYAGAASDGHRVDGHGSRDAGRRRRWPYPDFDPRQGPRRRASRSSPRSGRRGVARRVHPRGGQDPSTRHGSETMRVGLRDNGGMVG